MGRKGPSLLNVTSPIVCFRNPNSPSLCLQSAPQISLFSLQLLLRLSSKLKKKHVEPNDHAQVIYRGERYIANN